MRDTRIKYLLIILLLQIVQITGCRQASSSLDGDGIFAPTNISANALTTTKAKITWKNPEGDLESILLQFKKASDTDYTDVADVGIAEVKEIAGLTANTVYNVRVKAIGNEGSESPFSEIKTFNTSGTSSLSCPKAYNVFVATVGTSTHLTWEWDSNDFTNLTSYQIEKGPFYTTTFTNTLQSIVNNGNTPTDKYDDLSPGVGAIHYRIVSVCDGTAYGSDPSNNLAVLLPIPTNLDVAHLGSNNHKVTWDYPTGVVGLSGFEIKIHLLGGALYVNAAAADRTINTQPAACANNPNALATYWIRAIAADPISNSPYTPYFSLKCM